MKTYKFPKFPINAMVLSQKDKLYVNYDTLKYIDGCIFGEIDGGFGIFGSQKDYDERLRILENERFLGPNI